MKGKLQNTLLKTLEVRPKPYEVFDTDLPGFVLRIQPTGAQTYFCAYRTKAGRRARIRIGSASVFTPAQARDEAKKILADVARGRDPAADLKTVRAEVKRHTLRSFLDGHYQPWAEQNLNTGLEAVRRIQSRFNQFLSRPLHELAPWDLERWKTERLRKGTTANTVNRDLATLKAALSKAVDWNLLESHPLAKLKPARVKEDRRTRWLRDDEEERLRGALDVRELKMREKRANHNQWLRARNHPELPDLHGAPLLDHAKPMVITSLNTGLRRGELLSLRWENVDFAKALITVQGTTTKNRKTRHVPMNQEVLHVLQSWHNVSPNTDGLVFPSANGCKRDNTKSFWTKLLNDAGIEKFRWHDMRHHFASRLVMAGVDLNTVRELLGHADLKMTLRYAHLAPEHKAAAVAKLVRRPAANEEQAEAA